MFDHICTECDTRHLIFPSQITGMVNTDHGVTVSYTCWCGSDQTWSAKQASQRTLVAA